MADNLTDKPPTPSVLMELREERQVVQEGYRFLDEKRLLLAGQILRQLERYGAAHRAFLATQGEAGLALATAGERHGLQGLQTHPAAPMADARLSLRAQRFLGVALLDADLNAPIRNAPAPIDPSPEVRQCAERFAELIVQGAALAALSANLERLLEEYRRTQRRARALEDVLLPEIEAALKEVATRLEELDQEEAVRVRLDTLRQTRRGG